MITMKKIIDLNLYKKNKIKYQNYKKILKELKEQDILLLRIRQALKRYQKYIPISHVITEVEAQHKEIKMYIEKYELFLQNYDGGL